MAQIEALAAKNSGYALGVLNGDKAAEAFNGREEAQHAEREDGYPPKLHDWRAFNDFSGGA